MNLYKKVKDYHKVQDVIDSCKTLGQIDVAQKMVYNYGKMYDFNLLWSLLDKKISRLIEINLDYLDYCDRLK
jgi:hypothetical protein